MSLGSTRNCLSPAESEGSQESPVISLDLNEAPSGHRDFISPPVCVLSWV